MTAASAPPYAGVPVRLPEPRRSDQLAGRVAVVTGGGRGLGLAIACALADAGAAVVLAGRDEPTLHRAAAVVGDRGGRCAVQPCDVADPEQAASLVARCRPHLGAADILVNNAGVASREGAAGLDPEEFDRLMAVNARGVYYATLGAAQQFRSGGAVVNVSSVSTRTPDPELVAYAATKAAVEAMTRTFAVALGARGIRVNAVAPGYTDSPLNTARKADPERAEAVVGRTPLARWGRPADVADAVCYLASDRAAFVTGQVLAVDGGYPGTPQPRPAGVASNRERR